MPRGPKGEKRPADVIGNAVHVMRIATGEIEESARTRSESSRGWPEGRESAGGNTKARTAVRDRQNRRCRSMEEGRLGGFADAPSDLHFLDVLFEVEDGLQRFLAAQISN